MVVIKSNGGEMTLERGRQLADPHDGVGPDRRRGRGAARGPAARASTSLVTIDMGGTSTDCSTITGGRESFTTGFEIEWGLPIQIPMIDIRTIGAGGGSIAWIDKGGMLRVGPQSAGASPGPACYGTGGTEATVTDANLVLGRINPGISSAARWRSTPRRRTPRSGASPARSGKALEETAMAIVRIANTNMVGALRSVLIERGLDPRDFTLLRLRRRRARCTPAT